MNNNSIPSKFNGDSAENSLIHPSNQFRKRVGDQNLDQNKELIEDCICMQPEMGEALLNHIPAVAMIPEVADSALLADLKSLTIKPKSQKSRKKTEIKDVTGSSCSTSFVPRDIHMAKILHLLRVDLDAIDDKVNGNAKQKKGIAKVDRNWITQLLTVDWSNAFTEEGYVRVTHVMHMLPKLTNTPDAHKSLWISYRRLECAALGLADYNRRNEGAEYYLVKPINSQPARSERKYVSHANFLAKRKNDPEAPLELFYAEVLYSSDDVTICCRLEPRLYPPDISPPLENVKFKRARVIHPEGVSCFTCDRQCRRYL